MLFKMPLHKLIKSRAFKGLSVDLLIVCRALQSADLHGERALIDVGTYANSCDRSSMQPNPPKNKNVGTKVGQPLAASDLASVVRGIGREAKGISKPWTARISDDMLKLFESRCSEPEDGFP